MLRPSRVFSVVVVLLLALAGAWRGRGLFTPPQKSLSIPDTPRAVTNQAATRPENLETVSARQMTLERLAYAQAWDREQPPALAAFREWTQRYRAAPDPASRALLEAEGLALARARRPEMLALIKNDPARALALTVPAVVRAALPPAVLAELEARVAGRGDFTLLAALPQAGEPAPTSLRRVAFLGGVTYHAHAYGRRDGPLTKEGASLHGIAIGRDLALHESPLRALETGELPTAAADATCPVTALPVAATPFVAEAFGRTWEFCGTTDDMLEQFERRLALAEDGADPRMSPPGAPPIAAEATSSRTVGPQRVLVIRVDFSDFPGAAVSANEAQGTMDGNVRPFFEDASYGVTTLTSTVTSQVYRLPQTGSAYALADNEGQLHTDARNLASANYTLSDYSRIAVIFPGIGTSRVPGSLITFAGEASLGGSSIWINGTFSWQTVSHELGHTYGLYHSNLWRVTDGNPLSPNGTTLEYGDPFDMMGATSITGISRDTRHHFNHRFKNRLGWLPDNAVTTVTTSGTYRLYRFDHKDAAALNQPLALRVFRDGVRWYWIGYRQEFASGTPTANGAYVLWAFNNNQQSQLLDLTTPGVGANDAIIPVGATFTDAAYGIAIKVLARGGADPAQYLDVEITVPAAPPNVITAWGRETAQFFSTNTGAPVSPSPETSVPHNLTDVLALATGDAHVLALKADGTVVAWGDNTNGQTTVPAAAASGVASVAAGGNVSGVVKRDGTVVLWGESNNAVTTPPTSLTGVKQLVIGGGHSTGIYHALALKTDGTVVGWGSNSTAQINVPANATNVVALAACDRTSVALRADGTVVRWGVTFNGAVPFPIGLSGVAAIASSGLAGHVLALKTDGTVVGWGVNANDQATAPAGLTGVVAIAAGQFHSLALKADGSVVGWGSNSGGKLNVPPSLTRSYAIAASAQASYALIGAPAVITAQPQSQTIALGGNVTLSVATTNYEPAAYQWLKNGTPIAGATASTLTLSKVSASDSANYDVVLSFAGGIGRVTSSAATVTVFDGVVTNPARLINLSILTPLAAGETMTMGTALGGAGTSGTKALLVRAVGPSLAQLNVSGALADPVLAVFSGQTVIAANNDWAGSTSLSNAFAAVGAFPYAAASSKDAAVFNPGFVAGNYTVQVTGAGGAGLVIAELYDSTPASFFSAATPRLANVSVLKQIGAGQTLTAGFVVGGAGTKTVLIRAVGPGLAQLGVTGVMADPQLTLNQSGVTAPINSNDNWGGGATLATAFTNVGAFALPTASKDAALLVTLQPGNYTAQVTGVGGASGTTLVEVYEVP